MVQRPEPPECAKHVTKRVKSFQPNLYRYNVKECINKCKSHKKGRARVNSDNNKVLKWWANTSEGCKTHSGEHSKINSKCRKANGNHEERYNKL